MQDEPATPSLTHRTVGALFWMFLGTGAQAVLHVVVLIVLARLVTPTEFGLVGAALIVVNFSLTFSEMGLGAAIVQREQLEERHVRTGFTLSLLLGLLLGGLVFAFASSIAAFFRMENLTPALRVLSVALPVRGASLVAESLVQRGLRFRELALARVCSHAIGYGAVGLSMAFLDYGVWALVTAHLVQTTVLAALFLARERHPKRLQIDPGASRELFYFGGGLTAASLANTMANQGDRLVVGRWLGAAALGLYERAHQFMSLPAVLFGKVFSQVLFPAMARVQSDSVRLARAFRRSVVAIGLLALPSMAFTMIIAPELVSVTLGHDWDAVILPFQILVPGMLFGTVNKMSDSVARATGAVYRRAWRQGVFAALVLTASWVGQHWGLAGAAAGMIFALATNFALMSHLSLVLVRMSRRRFATAYLPGLFLATITFLVTYGIASISRGADAPAIVVLALCAIGALASVWATARWMPTLALTEDGLWLARTVSERLPPKWAGLVPLEAKTR